LFVANAELTNDPTQPFVRRRVFFLFWEIALASSLTRIVTPPLLVRAMSRIGWIKTRGQKQKHDRGGTKTTTISLRQTIRGKIVFYTLKHLPIGRVLKGVVWYFRPKLKNASAQRDLFLIGWIAFALKIESLSGE
jgi:hypothetical protein